MSDSSVASLAARRRVPAAVNEPIRSYAPGTPERASLKARLASMAGEHVDIPVIVNGKEYRTGDTAPVVMPHAHQHVLGTWHKATPDLVQQAIAASAAAREDWSRWGWEDRAAVFLRAAELLATTWRDTVNAATMLGQSKTAFQSEIDAACELIDFFRFNCAYAEDLYGEQPISDKGVWNQTDYRPLEGFIYAVSPFNFTAIGGNLSGAPALMGNTVIWKPAQTAMLSGYYVMKLLEAAGLPPGVINFVPGDPVPISDALLSHPDLGGVHFTGSTDGLQQHVEDDRQPHGPVPVVPAHRGRNRRQGLHHGARRRPTSTRSPSPSCAGPSSTRGRSAPPAAASTSRSRCGPASRSGWSR